MSVVGLGDRAVVGTLNYKTLEPPVSTTGKKFEIESGKTVSKDDLVMLNDAGKVYPVESTGSKNFDLPIGSEHTWGSAVNPQPNINTHFVAELEFIINYEENGNGVQMIGGVVDSSGAFTYGTKQEVFAGNNPLAIASAIDGSTYGSATVSGVSLAFYGGAGGAGTLARAFTYDKATKVFTFGVAITIGTTSGFNTGLAISSIDANRYIVSSTPDDSVYLLTVSGTTTSLTTTLSVPAMRIYTAITKISNTKVIVVYVNGSYNTDAQIVDISGNALTLGNIATSTYTNFSTFLATPTLSSTGKFYTSALVLGDDFSTNYFSLYEYSYDAGTDTITINNTPKAETTGNFTGSDISYFLPTNRIIVAGTISSNPAILIIDYDNSTFTPQLLDNSGNGNNTSSAIDNDGDIVVVYNDSNNGKSIFGTIGDLVSNLDPTKIIGVAVEGSNALANVSLNNSVCNASGLTINGSVFVSLKGVISNTTSFDAITIGKALSTTEYLIKI